jgi:hypothetical protein
VSFSWATEEQSGTNGGVGNDVGCVLSGDRSSAPNSLSIWTHHMQGLEFHDGFRPNGCGHSIDTPALTAAAGSQ